MPDALTDPLLELAQAQVKALVELKRAHVVTGEPVTIKHMRVALHSILAASPLMQRKAKAPRPPVTNTMTDDQFVAHLETKPHLKGVDVQREIGKCQLYFEQNGITPSRQRIVNWLNKAERTLGFNGKGQTSFAPKKVEPTGEPAGWREWVRENSTDASWADRSWDALDRAAQAYILGQLKIPVSA